LRRAGYLVAALGLFALAAWLMLPQQKPRPPRPSLEFPRWPRPHEIERDERRRTLAVPARARGGSAGEGDEGAQEPATVLVDPLHVALPPADLAVVVEAGAVLASPAGRMLLGCLSPPQAEALRELEARTGFAPLEQLERVAFTESSTGATTLVMSGDFAGLDLAQLADGASLERAGAKALVATRGQQAVAVWDRRMLIVGEPGGVSDALRRLDGEATAASALPREEMYGEMYGALSGASLSRLLPAMLGERLRGAAERVLVHVDASDDVLLVAEVHGAQRDALLELRQALAGALAMGRLRAVRDDDRLLADMLDESRVIPGDDSFQLEVALPLATLEEALGACARTPVEKHVPADVRAPAEERPPPDALEP
jgi:hypothetical protein